MNFQFASDDAVFELFPLVDSLVEFVHGNAILEMLEIVISSSHVHNFIIRVTRLARFVHAFRAVFHKPGSGIAAPLESVNYDVLT